MPPKLAFSANAYKRTDVLSAISDISAAGYKALEIYADVPHLNPLRVTKEALADVRHRIEQHGMRVSNVNAFTMYSVGDTWRPSFIESEPDRRQKRIDHTVAALEMAHSLNCATVSTEPGGPVEVGMSRGDALAMFEDSLTEVLSRTERLDTLILIEPEPGLLIENSGEMEEFLDILVHPRVAVNLDVGHFFCVGEDPALVIQAFTGRFDHVHLEDIAENREHRHLVPGDGAMDFRAIFEALADIGYDGYVTVELYPFEEQPGEAARRALKFLSPLWSEVFGAKLR